ncbi:MAG: toprim domain-containing protein [Defluviitaleaceae bacterium]|nr:toprim domain-containing protein [Defluviitaleaceae bacterium]MCL2274818.1 toprim domain-containing protein [Defluviitaleaceae bacterium]
MSKHVEYGNESITALKGADRVRKRPAVIFGSDGIEGCQHSIFEIISNSIDEARQGYGKQIEIIRHKDSSITVKDAARGAPVDYNPIERRYNWELLFCELYAGGKYENNEEDANYTYSLGLNGLGLCATQYASEYMDATVLREGFRYTLRFEKGENVGGLNKEPHEGRKTGTTITWRPDTAVFTDINVPLEWYKDMLKRQAIVNGGLVFVLKDEESGETFRFCYENGITDYINELAGENALTAPHFLNHETQGRDQEDKPEYKLKFEIAFCFSQDGGALEYYHNSSHLVYGGAPDKAVKAAFVSAIDGFLKTGGHYKKDEKKITFPDIEESLVLITNSFSTLISFENQTKKAITNKFIQTAMTDFLKAQLEIYFIENKADAVKLATSILANKRSRESAEKTRASLKKKLTGSIDLNNRVEKFVNCRTRDTAKRELYIVEGDSALGSCKLGRDADFQAIMPVRGKIFNCLKADYDRIFNNEIITDLLRVLGCGVELRGKRGRATASANKEAATFDINKLNWRRIVICTDADYDGYHIRTLILTMLYRLTPALIEEGKVFIAESPLYEITLTGKGKEETHFAYSEREKSEALDLAEKKGMRANIQRSKGLGENEPEMMWQTTMNPATRRLVQVIPTDAAKTHEMFEILLGDNLRGRKEFIEENGHLYIDLAETG